MSVCCCPMSLSDAWMLLWMVERFRGRQRVGCVDVGTADWRCAGSTRLVGQGWAVPRWRSTHPRWSWHCQRAHRETQGAHSHVKIHVLLHCLLIISSNRAICAAYRGFVLMATSLVSRIDGEFWLVHDRNPWVIVKQYSSWLCWRYVSNMLNLVEIR